MSAYPDHWIRGQLLDLKKYHDGSARAWALGDDEKQPSLGFESLHEAQNFISAWYARDSVGGVHG
jgi:hypothetical protein